MFKKRLSQVLWAISKGYVVDTKDWKFPINQEVWVPVVAAPADILGATWLTAAVTTLVTAGITDPAILRNVSITWNAAWINGDVIIKGTDWADRSITESIASAGTATVAWVVAFKTVTSVLLPILDTAWDTISVGTGASLGLYRDIEADADVLNVTIDWVREAAATVDNVNNTITVTTAFNWIVYVAISYLITTF